MKTVFRLWLLLWYAGGVASVLKITAPHWHDTSFPRMGFAVVSLAVGAVFLLFAVLLWPPYWFTRAKNPRT